MNKIKEEKQRTLQRLRELNKTIFEYEMRFFLISKKQEISHPHHLSILKKVEKKVQKRLNKS